MDFGSLLFSFRGRINRAKWWLSVLVVFVIAIVVNVLSALFSSGAIATILSLVYLVLWIWISLAAGTKRLHDLNRSGAWLVLFIGAPILLFLIMIALAGFGAGLALLGGGTPDVGALTHLGIVGAIMGLLWLGLGIWALVWFGCLRGTVGPNNYGPDPLAPGM